MTTIIVFFLTCAIVLGLAISRHLWSKKADKQRSITGVSVLSEYIKLIKLTQQHRGAHSGLLNGKAEFQSKLNTLETQIENIYNNILDFENNHSYPKSLSVHYSYKQWQRLISNKQLKSSESFQLHSGLLARQLDALWDISDEFSLTSNRHQDVRELAQQLVKTLPELAEALGQVRALSVLVASRGDMSSDKKLQLMFTVGKIEKYHQDLVTPLPHETNEELQAFLNNLKTNVQSSQLSEENPDDLFQTATQVIDDLFIFIDSGFKLLTETIEKH